MKISGKKKYFHMVEYGIIQFHILTIDAYSEFVMLLHARFQRLSIKNFFEKEIKISQ